ncbi:MAG: Hsp20/alpha crystallin family protein [Jhaorihella sp.]
MVEKSYTSGLWPLPDDPFRAFGSRPADWLSPATDASVGERGQDIGMELPGVAEDDIEPTVENGVVTVRGETRPSRRRRAAPGNSAKPVRRLLPVFRLPEDAGRQGPGADEGWRDAHDSAEAEVEKSRKIAISRG